MSRSGSSFGRQISFGTTMTSIHRPIFFSAVERYGSLLLFLFSTAVLSRLLTPGEFGIYAVTNAVISCHQCFISGIWRDANYLIQKKMLSEQNIRTAFTITFGISIMVGMALFICSDALVWFFRQEGLKASIAVSTLNFAVTPFSVVISALFRRDMEFGKLAICESRSECGLNWRVHCAGCVALQLYGADLGDGCRQYRSYFPADRLLQKQADFSFFSFGIPGCGEVRPLLRRR